LHDGVKYFLVPIRKSRVRNRRPLNWLLLDSKLSQEIGEAKQRWGSSPE
jgi:hypothetical protein